MKSSLTLGRISGIKVGVHWTVGIIAFLVMSTVSRSVLPSFAPGFGTTAYLVASAGIVVAFLASIVAHELGHSIVAQRNGVGVRSITLFALGGVASLEREPDSAGAAARIALAGPAVSLGLGIAALGVSMSGVLVADGLLAASVLWIGLINLSLAVFNMIPALPLDGGRVLQAAMWHRTGERLESTVSAARVGRWLGWGIVAFGVWQFATTGGGLMTAFIGWFVVASAKGEGRQARLQLRQRKMQQHMQDMRRNGAAPSPLLFSLVDLVTGRAPKPAPVRQVVDVSGRPLNSDTHTR